MRFCTKINAYGFTGAALLGILALTNPTLALAEGRPGPEFGTRLAQAPQAPPAQPAPAQAQPIWGMNCAGTAAGLDCRAFQDASLTNTSRLAVVVHVPPETKKPVLLLVLPFGLYLPAGVTLQFGQDAAKMVPIKTCDGTACLAEYAITDAEIAGMTKGQAISISVQDVNRQPTSVQVPTTGFAAAYAKIK